MEISSQLIQERLRRTMARSEISMWWQKMVPRVQRLALNSSVSITVNQGVSTICRGWSRTERSGEIDTGRLPWSAVWFLKPVPLTVVGVTIRGGLAGIGGTRRSLWWLLLVEISVKLGVIE